ncbi:MAG: class I SAM-dependent methyltransferase [Chlorobiaceae bacterium]|nr:class I SAM-dependent methyltransferase [Chlorobiaceae bacterium]NTW11536.1 class I SAM-dependent methyltransferase [Chlorobiaceae bacterium]
MHTWEPGTNTNAGATIEAAADPIEVFRADWGTYQTVIRENYMFHRDISASVGKLLEALPGPLKVLDLGCGDSSQVVEMFRPGQVAEYCGCDLSREALDAARVNLGPFGNRAELLCKDMLAVLRDAPDAHYDLVYSSYALHHLPFEEKQLFFSECRRTLHGTGLLILADIMREEGETMSGYYDRYIETMDAQWVALSDIERGSIQEHIRGCDFPEPSSVLLSMAEREGLRNPVRLEKRTWHQAWCYQA